MKTKAIDGFFLSFPPSEMEFIKDKLIEIGYTADNDGLKNFILDALAGADEIEEKPADRVINKVEEYLKNNPEKVNMYGRMVGMAIKNLVKNRKAPG